MADTKEKKLPKYIDGVGWRYDTEHSMTRWPDWKDSHMPGTYMITLNVSGGRHVLGHLEGTSKAIRDWMQTHRDAVQAASNDPYYYRHALLGTKAMPFVLKTDDPAFYNYSKALPSAPPITPIGAVETAPNKEALLTQSIAPRDSGATGSASLSDGGAMPGVAQDGRSAASTALHNGEAVLVRGRFDGVAVTKHRKTHFPVEALALPDAPHIVLSPLGEKVKEIWERMPVVVPQVHHVCLAIMPNHIHAIIYVHSEMPRAIGAVLRSFMGTSSHALHQMIAAGTAVWKSSAKMPDGTAVWKSSAKMPGGASIKGGKESQSGSTAKPSLWEEGYCVGVCQNEENLHTRIGYVLENPFFGILEREEPDLMQRALRLKVAGRLYGGYGNPLLLKEPERIQVFCHRKHPVTHEPYINTNDFRNEKAAILRAVNNGAVIVTPGISPGEADIMWSVLQAGGKVINIQKEEISDKWHPEKQRRIYCSQGQMLVLAVNDLPRQQFYDSWGQPIPMDTQYVRFHLLNYVAAEICAEGIEYMCEFVAG